MANIWRVKGLEFHHDAKLASCPFCGELAVMANYNGGYFVKCTCCDAMLAKQVSCTAGWILPFKTVEEATRRWNKRNGVEARARREPNKSTPEEILRERDIRVDRIVGAIQRAKGEVMTTEDIAQDCGIAVSIVRNNMYYVKRKYPEVKSEKYPRGYRWEPNDD